MNKYLGIIFALCLILPHFAHADITTGLYGEWKLNEGSGTTAADSSGNSNTGTLSGVVAPGWATGNLYASALSNTVGTGGSGGYVSTTNAVVGNVFNMTESAWVYPTSLSGQSGFNLILSTNNGQPFIEVNSSAQFTFSDRNNTLHIYTGTTIPTNTWTHLAVTCAFDNVAHSTTTMYINGSQVKQDTGSNDCAFNFATMKWVIATYGLSLGNFGWAGRLQDVRAYTRALTSSDIAELYAFPPVTVVLDRIKLMFGTFIRTGMFIR